MDIFSSIAQTVGISPETAGLITILTLIALLGLLIPFPPRIERRIFIEMVPNDKTSPILGVFYLSDRAQQYLLGKDNPIIRLLPNGHKGITVKSLDDETYCANGVRACPDGVFADSQKTYVVEYTSRAFNDANAMQPATVRDLYQALINKIAVNSHLETRAVLRYDDAVVEIVRDQAVLAYLQSLAHILTTDQGTISASDLADAAIKLFDGYLIGPMPFARGTGAHQRMLRTPQCT